MTLPNGVYSITRRMRFRDSDPAGIVFYPVFFEMFNDLFEDWIENVLGIVFADQFFVQERMFPLIHVEVDFKAARVMGQSMELVFILTGIGNSSIRYTIVGRDRELECMRGNFVSCIASRKHHHKIDWPADMRANLENYLKVCEGIEI